MIPVLIAVDYQLFFLINGLPHSPALDTLALTVSGIGRYGLIYVLFAVLLFMREEKKDHIFFLPAVFSIFFSWLSVLIILKPLIARLRPLERYGAIIVEVGRVDYSFPSFHATIAWALAYVLASKEPRYKGLFYALAFLISLSRIYLGVHFPLDVFIGSCLGYLIGYSALWVEQSVKES